MKSAKDARKKRRDSLAQQISSLELSTTGLDFDLLLQLKNQLKLEETLEAERMVKFTREFWAGKINKPNKNMFKLLKKKNLREQIPMLINEDGIANETDHQNLHYIHSFYSNTFAKDPIRTPESTQARALIAKTREKTISSPLSKLSLTFLFFLVKSLMPFLVWLKGRPLILMAFLMSSIMPMENSFALFL